MHGHYRGSWWEYINAWTLGVVGSILNGWMTPRGSWWEYINAWTL